MMRQKALKVFTDIRDGEDSTKALMNKYGFRHYTQFSRFCKNYLLQATPAQLINFDQEEIGPPAATDKSTLPAGPMRRRMNRARRHRAGRGVGHRAGSDLRVTPGRMPSGFQRSST